MLSKTRLSEIFTPIQAFQIPEARRLSTKQKRIQTNQNIIPKTLPAMETSRNLWSLEQQMDRTIERIWKQAGWFLPEGAMTRGYSLL